VDYRQLYKDHYGIEFGRDMVVHHIDFDRSNNSISNLLLLPNNVHSKYHMMYSRLFGLDGNNDLSKDLQLTNLSALIYYLNSFSGMSDALADVMPWMRMKECFDMMPRDVWEFAYNTRQVITKDSV
jgi:hypothetical protein